MTPSHWAARIGGAELQIRWLIDELVNREKVALTYLARHIPEEFADDRYRIRRIESVPALHRFGYWPDTLSLRHLLQEEQPDVIYQRNGCAYTGICAAHVRKHGGRLFWHISIDNDLDEDIGRFPPVSRQLERRIRDFGIRHSDCIIAQSRYQQRLLGERFGKEALLIRNFHPPVSSTYEKAEPPTVVWVANLKPAKRPELFLEIARKVSQKLGLKFVMVGRGGDREPYASMLEGVSELDSFSYVGGQSLDEVNGLIGAAHILVNTSSVEGFPNTFLQAWLRNTVVVSLGIDPDGVIQARGLGFVAKTTSEAAQAIERLFQNEGTRLEVAGRAMEYALENHSLRNASALASCLVGEPA